MDPDATACREARAAVAAMSSRPSCGARAMWLAILASILAACSLTFDWREVRPAGNLSLLFPCKPDRVTRQVALAGAPQAMTLWSCSAGDLTFAISQVEASDAARIEPLLQALRTALAGNLGGAAAAESRAEAASVAGATPHPLAQRLLLRGQRADGSAIEAQAQFFTHGQGVFQATVIGSRLDRQALDMFFSSLKFAT